MAFHADWLRTVMNRIDADLFAPCLGWPTAGRTNQNIAIDGKPQLMIERPVKGLCTWCLPPPRPAGSCWARRRSTRNRTRAIPALLDRIELASATVTIDAMGCQPEIAQKILDESADYVPALKGN
jgi:hypothetical protein